ncbi:MAG: mannitol-1-phosphate 5-dehydrogenase, partial [Firmicutes bacterium]|nr:mannitol-1-phosphate 5-dehydrogenase [Bacillota bacterium]
MVRGRRKAVIFGAGASGRGHIGHLAYASGYQLVFVDVDRSLVEELEKAGRYTVHLVGTTEQDVTITGYRAYSLRDEETVVREIAACDLVLTAVTAEGLPGVVPCLCRGIMARADCPTEAPLNVVACENMIRGSSSLREQVVATLDPRYLPYLQNHIGFPDAMIARVVPAPTGNRMHIVAEDYNEWVVDRNSWLGPPPDIQGLELVDNLQARLERKIYIHNAGHAVCGYLGYLRGHHLMCDAIADPWIREIVDGAMSEAGQALIRRFGFSRASIDAYRAAFFPRVAARQIPDPVARVIRSPKRKLGRKERLLGPACMAIDYGLACGNLAMGI